MSASHMCTPTELVVCVSQFNSRARCICLAFAVHSGHLTVIHNEMNSGTNSASATYYNQRVTIDAMRRQRMEYENRHERYMCTRAKTECRDKINDERTRELAQHNDNRNGFARFPY